MSQLPVPPSSLASSGGARSFLLVFQSMAHALAYKRLGGGKSTMKIVEQARKGDDPVLVYGMIPRDDAYACVASACMLTLMRCGRIELTARLVFVWRLLRPLSSGTLNVLREMDVRVSGA